ncbi:hypothetical protein M408DRAFT_329845 [Serendipita vermifera MAFF 305830]|uniref:C2 NT-type domain-containing protein n=1 Tax=Serendipita vermifera MAFF 305830 TaxID=933852 RepID=A0A0C3ATP1_SERVB|nr:hypothetical protein M408DRAFT_329845 [Serendipita vermifera MAFF 305830]
MAAHQFEDKKQNLKVLISAIGSKEVNCRVRLTIHNVTNLPVLDGAFRVRWKFRDVDSKAVKQSKKEHEDRLHNDAAATPMTHHSDSSSLLANALLSDISHSSTNSSSGKAAPKPIDFNTDERGTTAFKNMRRDHTVTFEHTVEVVASMRVVKGELIGEPLKLVIERKTEESETMGANRKFEPRVGHKYIDLAEFVNEGKVRRKYLLEKSKTNAMVTISLDITTTKTGVEFRKPALRQDHLLFGRKEPARPPPRELAPLNTANKPTLKRNSSTTSTSTSSSAGYKRAVLPVKSETEAVIEALFNPTIFKTSTPVITESPPALNTGNKFEEALTPRPRSNGRDLGNDSDSDSSDDFPHSYHSDKRSSLSGSHSRPHSPNERRTGSLASQQQRTALDLAIDINQRKLRPQPQESGHSWTLIDTDEGAPRVKRAPPRANTGDSEFSTTSSDPHPPGSDSPRPLSPAQSFGRPGMPSIKIQSGTPVITQEGGKGRFLKGHVLRKGSASDAPVEMNEPGTPIGRRATAPAHVRSGPRRSSAGAAGGGIAAALASAGKMSMDVGGRLGSLDLGPQAAQEIRSSADATKGRRSMDGQLASGQKTPTPGTVEKTFAGLVQT